MQTKLLWELFELHAAWETTVFQPVSSSAPAKLSKCWFPMLALPSWAPSLSQFVDCSSMIWVVLSAPAECPAHPVPWLILENDHVWATRHLKPDWEACWHVCFPGKWVLVVGSTEKQQGTHTGSCLVQSCACVKFTRRRRASDAAVPWLSTCATPPPQVFWRSDGVMTSVILVSCPTLYTKSWLFLGLLSHCSFFPWPEQPRLRALSKKSRRG